MPHKRHRFTISTSSEIYETISHLAKLQKRSRSAVVNDLLESVHDPLRRTIVLLEAAQDAPRQIREGLRKTVSDLEREVTGDLGKNSAQLELLVKQIQSDSKRADG